MTVILAHNPVSLFVAAVTVSVLFDADSKVSITHVERVVCQPCGGWTVCFFMRMITQMQHLPFPNPISTSVYFFVK